MGWRGELKAMPNWGSFFTPGILKWLTGASDNILAEFSCIIAIHFTQMRPKFAFIPKQHTHNPFDWDTQLRCSQQLDYPRSAICGGVTPSLSSLTLQTPLRQGASSPRKKESSCGRSGIVWVVPGSHASVLRTAKLRFDQTRVMVQRRWSGGHGHPSAKAGDKKIRTKAKIETMKAEVRLIN